MRTRCWVLRIMVTLFFVCLVQGKTYAWFHSSNNFENRPIFESPRREEIVSKTYIFLPNTPDAMSGVRLYKTASKNMLPVSAGELKVDIPFNLLSSSVTNVQALLDRQVAANLRLKNLLQQYLAQQKKNAELLNDLKIPYLEAKDPSHKAEPTTDTKKLSLAAGLKKKIEEEIIFQAGGKDGTALQDSQNFKLIQTGKQGQGNSVSDLEKYERSYLNDGYSKSQRRTDIYHKTDGRDIKLPWIFSFGLKLLRYMANNKSEILSGACIMGIIGLVGTIVVKR